MLKVDLETLEKDVYSSKSENADYKDAYNKYFEALNTKDTVKIDDAVGLLEAVSLHIDYSKGFHDGMQFILKALAGQEVISL